jgi:hypothetical protein
MTVSIRFLADDRLQRRSKQVMEGLVHGYDAMPQFGTNPCGSFPKLGGPVKLKNPETIRHLGLPR